MKTASLCDDGEDEPLRFKWIESEKASCDLGEVALRRWIQCHWWGYFRSRWLEHLQGKRFWGELDRGDFGLLPRKFHEHSTLLDRILDRLKAGQGNLEVIGWAQTWGLPVEPVLRILEAVDIISRRLIHRFDLVDSLETPAVRLDLAWLAWEGGTILHLARSIAEEQAFDRLPILGDALEEAGCVDVTILEHCRSGGRHTVRSWVVDLILIAS